jgi:hypothetical protein
MVWLGAALLIGGSMTASVAALASDWPDWTGTRPVNISHSSWGAAWQPAIAAADGQVAAVWSDRGAAGVRDIYVAWSNDGGRTWPASPTVVSPTADYSMLPDVLLVDGQAYVAWVDLFDSEGGKPTALYEAEVTAGGVSSVRKIPSALPLELSTRPSVANGSGRLYVVFNAGDPPHVLCASRQLTETAWPTATVIYTSTTVGGSWFPALAPAPDGETLHVVWIDIGLGLRVIRYMHWDPAAAGSEVYTLSQPAPNGAIWGRPSIAVDPTGGIHVAWEEEIGGGSPESRDRYVRYTRYDAGDGWSEPVRVYASAVRVNADDPRNIVPALALREQDGDVTVCVAWHGFRPDTPDPVGAEEILITCSQDGGHSWPTWPQNMSRSPTADEVSIMPAVGFDPVSGRLHGAWQERGGSGNYQIHTAYSLDHQVMLPLIMRNGK